MENLWDSYLLHIHNWLSRNSGDSPSSLNAMPCADPASPQLFPLRTLLRTRPDLCLCLGPDVHAPAESGGGDNGARPVVT